MEEQREQKRKKENGEQQIIYTIPGSSWTVSVLVFFLFPSDGKRNSVSSERGT